MYAKHDSSCLGHSKYWGHLTNAARSSTLVLDTYCPRNFSSNLLQPTCLIDSGPESDPELSWGAFPKSIIG